MSLQNKSLLSSVIDWLLRVDFSRFQQAAFDRLRPVVTGQARSQ